MRYFLICLFALLTACGSSAPSVKPFKMDIQQGNVVTSKMLLQLRPGMTKSQVRFIMGSPLIVDSFHKDRWDYFYQLRQAGKIVEQRRVILDFDKELLTKVRGDVVPEGTAGAATGNESSVAKTITIEPKPKEQTSWTDKLKFWKKDETVIDKAAKAKITKDAVKPAAEESKSAAVETVPQANVDAAADTPSILAVPIGGVLIPDRPAIDAPASQAPAVETTKPEPTVIIAPVVEEPTAIAPVAELPKVELQKPKELQKVAPKTVAVPMPAAKAGERLIFRIDRNLELKNLESENLESENLESINLESKNIESAPVIEAPVDNKVKPKPKFKQLEQPVPPAEEPGYFERMLEKIGF